VYDYRSEYVCACLWLCASISRVSKVSRVSRVSKVSKVSSFSKFAPIVIAHKAFEITTIQHRYKGVACVLYTLLRREEGLGGWRPVVA
jgi:hypothetical protein